MKKLIHVSGLLLFAAAVLGNVNEKPRLTLEGLGPIRIGMSVKQVTALGFKLTSSGPWSDEEEKYSCHYLDSAPDFPGIALMMNEDRVVRIDIGFRSGAESWQSLSGAKIGMSEAEVRAIYGDWLRTSGHPYLDDAGSYLSLTSGDGKYAMIFETSVKDMDAQSLEANNQFKYITDFRSGLSGPVGYIECCA